MQELDELQDPIIKQKAILENNNMKEVWDMIKDLVKGRQDLFPNPRKNDFFFWFMAVTSRCFGAGLPCIMMVPFVDNMNHTNIQSEIGLWQRGMDDTTFNTQLRVKRPVEDIPTNCKVWESEYESASEEDDEEPSDQEGEGQKTEKDWTWYNAADPTTVYFKLTTVSGIKKDKQIFIKYGQISNRHLLLYFGFSLPDNRFDVVHVKHENFTFKLRLEKYCKDIVNYYRRKVLGNPSVATV